MIAPRIVRWVAMLAVLLAAPALAATIEIESLRVGGEKREYLLASPAGAKRREPLPLVLLLHGHLGTAANALGQGRMPSPLTAWLDIADRERVLLAALQGLRGPDRQTGWRDCRRDNLSNPRSDDVAFAEAVVRKLTSARRADARRVYVMGMSNGAMMTLRLALEMRPVPVAVAAAAGSMAGDSDCRAAREPVSVLLIHGTADPLVPYEGGMVGPPRRPGGLVIGVPKTRDAWLATNGLTTAAPQRHVFPVLGASVGTSALRESYGPATGPQVAVLTVQGGGHIEPSLRFHPRPLYGRFVGPQNHDLESAEEAWAFFRDKLRR